MTKRYFNIEYVLKYVLKYVRDGVVNMSILNATTARKNFFKLMEDTVTTHEPTYITGKNGNVVVLSEEDFRSMQETLYLLSIPGMREKIINGLKVPPEELIEDSDGLLI